MMLTAQQPQQFKQGSPEWHQWRSKGIGASDMPIIMGLSKYKTPFQLWEEKVFGPKPSEGKEPSPAASRGNVLESAAREHYEHETGLKMEPITLIHPTIPFIRASLDGYNKEHNLILEIKCPGKEDHETAKKGEVPYHYIWQVQHQMAVANADMAHYYSFDGEDGMLVRVPRDDIAIAKLIEVATKFWDLVLTQEPPELLDRDYLCSTDKELSALITTWRDTTGRIKDLEALQDQIRKDILQRCKHPRVKCNGLKIIETYRKGNIDYAKIPELKGLNLEPYRKKGSSSFRFLDELKPSK